MTYEVALSTIQAKYAEGYREILVPHDAYLGYAAGLMSIERSGPPRPWHPNWLAYKDARVYRHPENGDDVAFLKVIAKEMNDEICSQEGYDPVGEEWIFRVLALAYECGQMRAWLNAPMD